MHTYKDINCTAIYVIDQQFFGNDKNQLVLLL